MSISRTVSILTLVLLSLSTLAQKVIPKNEVIATENLINYLSDEVRESLESNGIITEAALAEYFRQSFSDRYYYDWKTFESRFKLYNEVYNIQYSHTKRANDHMQKFADSTHWKLPFKYMNGEEVNAYALRHLARQHKMVDVAYQYYYNQKDPQYINYFTRQMASLNNALETGNFETLKGGNGVYEAFRSGYRILNWLSIHNMFLGEEAYSDTDQLITIATLLQHGADLYATNSKFRSGNHQTRGMSALAMLSILLRDFEGTDLWYERAMQILEEHLDKEINEDGFQFERSVHYHMSDIENYFYVYQLAKRSNIEVSEYWKGKLEDLFTTLVKIAYPDKSAPVLQDDTDRPWAEKNDISGALTIGYILFEDPQFGYLAENYVEDKIYWFINEEQLNQLESIARKKPSYGSLTFPDTKYYIMREGWGDNDKMMVVSAGLDKDKPDHQHGDMLGVQAMANGNVVLPNYQVRYSLPDFELFKNSMVKNVALVDDELQGKDWTSNRGGSGFGKFKSLPNPQTISWQTNADFDFFAGSHNGFENVGVGYSRQVIYVKNDFWIIKDNFDSDNKHTYKQVWQGHYTNEEGPNLLRANFTNASGCDILQLAKVDESSISGKRGKQWSVVSKNNSNKFSFITVVFPYRGYNNRINENDEAPDLYNWKLNELSFQAKGDNLKTISKEQKAYLFNVNQIQIEEIKIELTKQVDVFIELKDETITIHSIACEESGIVVSGSKSVQFKGSQSTTETILKPGDIIIISKI